MLTNKVLPCDLMVRFELARPTSGSSHNARLLLQPSRILHPRFEDRTSSTGKALWVTCWSEAVATLAQKGSYKRLHSSASVPHPAAVTAQVHSLLTRRIAHEADLLAERVKAWPAAWVPHAGEAPLRRVRGEEVEDVVRGLSERGRRVLGVLDTAALPSPPSENPAAARFATPLAYQPGFARRYYLPAFVSGVVLPPSALPPTSDPQPAEDHLLETTTAPLRRLTALLARRFARSTSASSPHEPDTEAAREGECEGEGEGESYVLSAPPNPVDSGPAAQRQAEDPVPLLVALERARLWTGEGWRLDEEEGVVASSGAVQGAGR